eukprot:1169150_1
METSLTVNMRCVWPNITASIWFGLEHFPINSQCKFNIITQGENRCKATNVIIQSTPHQSPISHDENQQMLPTIEEDPNAEMEEAKHLELESYSTHTPFVLITMAPYNEYKPIQLSPSLTVHQMNQIIRSKWNIEAFNLFYRNKLLNHDNVCLSEYDIVTNCDTPATINCVLRSKPVSYRQTQKQYVDDVSGAANRILSNMKNNVQHINNQFDKVQKQIDQIQTISELSIMRHAATSAMQKQMWECRDPERIRVFKKSSHDLIANISDCHHWNRYELDKEHRQYTIKQAKLRKELLELDAQIEALQKREIECTKRHDEVTNAIRRSDSDKERQETDKAESIDKIRSKVAEVDNAYHDLLQNTQHNETLSEIMDDKLVYLEENHNNWSVEDVIGWIKMIENGYFDGKDYATFFEQISRLKVNGSQLKEMNSTLFLKMAGLNEQNQRVLVGNIARITKQQKQRNICGFCTQNMINTAMIPCGHQYSCNECAKKHRLRKCPICRKPIREIVKTYMAGF